MLVTSNNPKSIMSAGPKRDRLEQLTTAFPERCFASDQFGPLPIRPHDGTSWSPKTGPDRPPATYHRTHGIRYFHGCHSLGDDQLWGGYAGSRGAVLSHGPAKVA